MKINRKETRMGLEWGRGGGGEPEQGKPEMKKSRKADQYWYSMEQGVTEKRLPCGCVM